MIRQMVCALAVTLVVSNTREAKAASDAGLDLGFRTGFGLPLGKVDDDESRDINYAVPGQIPIWIDLGYRFKTHFVVGAYFQYGFLLTAHCDSGASCSGSDIRTGAEFQYRIQPDASADPWLGAGVGYEWFNVFESFGGQDLSIQARGFEFLRLEAGLDFAAAEEFGLGPFLSLSLAEFSDASADIPGLGSGSASIPHTSLHDWLMIGVRGVYDP